LAECFVMNSVRGEYCKGENIGGEKEVRDEEEVTNWDLKSLGKNFGGG